LAWVSSASEASSCALLAACVAMSVSSCFCGIALCAAGGRSRATFVSAFDKFAADTATCAFACASAASKGVGSISYKSCPFFDEEAVAIILPEQIALNPRCNLRIVGSVKLGDPFCKDRNIAAHNFRHVNIRRPGRTNFLLAFASSQKCG
jgi:hypothetical protein